MLIENLSCFTKPLWSNTSDINVWTEKFSDMNYCTLHIMPHMCNCTIRSVPNLHCLRYIWVCSQLARGQLSVQFSVSVNSKLGPGGTFAALTNGSPLLWLSELSSKPMFTIIVSANIRQHSSWSPSSENVSFKRSVAVAIWPPRICSHAAQHSPHSGHSGKDDRPKSGAI